MFKSGQFIIDWINNLPANVVRISIHSLTCEDFGAINAWDINNKFVAQMDQEDIWNNEE